MQLFERFMALCALHSEMRMLERVCTRLEQLLRERAASGNAAEKMGASLNRLSRNSLRWLPPALVALELPARNRVTLFFCR